MHTWVIVIIIIICVIALALVVTGVGGGNFASYRYLDINRFLKGQLDPADDAMNKSIMECAEAMLAKKEYTEYEITSSDGLRLHGYLLKGDSASDVYVLCSHGYRDPYGGFEFAEKAPIWQPRGYHLFFVDHRAHSKSEGKYISFGQHEADDCIKWIEFMKREFGENIRVILHGQSMGGATVLQMAGRKTLPDNVKLVIGDCGYTDFYTQCEWVIKLPSFPKGILMFTSNWYLRLFHRINMKKADSLTAVKKAKVPILFIHGEKDKFVPSWMSEKMYKACASEHKQIELFPEGTHCTSYAHNPERYTRVVYEFTDKYL